MLSAFVWQHFFYFLPGKQEPLLSTPKWYEPRFLLVYNKNFCFRGQFIFSIGLFWKQILQAVLFIIEILDFSGLMA
jgi:hypothetical protein